MTFLSPSIFQQVTQLAKFHQMLKGKGACGPSQAECRVCLPLLEVLPLFLEIRRQKACGGKQNSFSLDCHLLEASALAADSRQHRLHIRLRQSVSLVCIASVCSLISIKLTDKPRSVAKSEFSWALNSYSSKAEGPP